MKNWKSVTMGFVAGAMVMTVTPAFGAVYKSVSAMLVHDATFKINDKVSVTEGNQPVLNYNNYTYVPTRFVAQALGCEVNWDPTMRQVVIKSPEQKKEIVYQEKVVEKIVYVDKDDDVNGDSVYSKMPALVNKGKYDVLLRNLILPDKDSGMPAKTKLYLNLKNISADRVELAQETAELTLDGKEYDITRFDSQLDKKWDETRLEKDDDVDGYLIFDGTNQDYTKGTLKVDVRLVDNNDAKVETITFNFKR